MGATDLPLAPIAAEGEIRTALSNVTVNLRTATGRSIVFESTELNLQTDTKTADRQIPHLVLMRNGVLWYISELYLQLGLFQRSFDGFREIANAYLAHGMTQQAIGAFSKESFEKVRYGDPAEALEIRRRCLEMVQEAKLEYQFAWNYWEMGENSLDWLSPPIAKMWMRLGPYVKHVRTLRKAKDYYVPAEYIGELCIQWRRDKGYADEEYVEKTP